MAGASAVYPDGGGRASVRLGSIPPLSANGSPVVAYAQFCDDIRMKNGFYNLRDEIILKTLTNERKASKGA
jgi:hypothetical protein